MSIFYDFVKTKPAIVVVYGIIKTNQSKKNSHDAKASQ